ncbi:MAG TPA: methyltransferase [Casimicrobiaceae bacterium]|nr:methyltransferase [Casimicrobiaceae bacterium]
MSSATATAADRAGSADEERSVEHGVDSITRAVTGAAMVQALAAAAELGLAQALARGPTDVDELAAQVGCDGDALQRLLRALASLGLCEQREANVFALTPAGAILDPRHVPSLHHWLLWWGRYMWTEWAELAQCVRTGESGRMITRRGRGFDQLEHDARAAATFHAAMSELTQLVAQSVARHEVFVRSRTVVDVGGGCGELLSTILRRHDHLHGVLFERPHAIEAARETLRTSGVSSRIEPSPGDFMHRVASGGDVYLLKSILHDWDDDRGATILRRCADAMNEHGCILVIEQVMPPRIQSSPEHQDIARRDLTMMVGPGGRERTEQEFRRLFARSGLECRSMRPAAMGFSMLEAVPRTRRDA